MSGPKPRDMGRKFRSGGHASTWNQVDEFDPSDRAVDVCADLRTAAEVRALIRALEKSEKWLSRPSSPGSRT